MTVTSRDKFGNSRSVLPMGAVDSSLVTATLDGGAPRFKVLATRASNDTYVLAVVCTIAGSYSMSVTITPSVGAPPEVVSGSPFSFEALAGTMVAKESRITSNSNGRYVSAGSQFQMELVGHDAYGNRIAQGAASAAAASVSQATGALYSTTTLTTASQVLVSITASGWYSSHVHVGGVAVIGSPIAVNVIPGQPSATTSVVTRPAPVVGKESWISVLVKDSHGNVRLSSSDIITVTVTNPSSIALTVTSVGFADQVHTFSVTPTVTGAHSLSVTIDGTSVTGSPFTWTAVASAGSAIAAVTTARLSTPSTLTAGSSTVAKVSLTDGAGALAASAAMGTVYIVAKHAGVAIDPAAAVTAINNDVYDVPLTLTASGTYSLDVYCCSATLTVAIPVVVVAGAPSSTQSAISSSPSASTVGTTTTVVAFVRDSFGNAVPVASTGTDAPVRSVAQNVNCLRYVTVAVSNSGGGGQYRVDMTATAAGNYSVGVIIGNAHIQLSPVFINVAPEPPSGTHSEIAGAALYRLVAGEPTTFSLIIRDRFGNAVDPNAAANQFLAVANLPGGGSATVSLTSSIGTLSVDYVLTLLKAGSWQLSVTHVVTGAHAIGSPASAVVVAGQPDPAQTRLDAAAVTNAIAGQPVSGLFIRVEDSYQNARTSGTQAITLQVTSLTRPSVAATTSIGTNNILTVAFVPPGAGAYSVRAFLDGIEISSSPASVNIAAGRTSLGASQLSGPGLTAALAGVAASFSVQLRDVYGTDKPVMSRISSGMETFDTMEVQLTQVGGSSSLPVSCQHATVALVDGNAYICTYTATAAGTYALSVHVTSPTAVVEPARVVTTIVGPADINAATTTATGSSLSVATAGAAAVFNIWAHDAYHNDYVYSVFAGTPSLTATAVKASITESAVFTNHRNGTITSAVKVTVAGAYALNILLAGIHVSGSPFALVVKTGRVDASHSELLGAGSVTLATAGMINGITIQAKDAFENQVDGLKTGFTAQLKIKEHGRTVVSPVSNASWAYANLYNGTMSATISGAWSLVVLWEGAHISGSPLAVQVEPAAEHAPSCVVQGLGGTIAQAHAVNSFMVKTHDQFGNFVNKRSAVFGGIVNGTGVNTTAVTISAVQAGTYRVTYLAGAVGANSMVLNITLGGNHISGSPFSVTGVSSVGVASASRSNIIGGMTRYLIAGSTLAFTLQARDSQGIDLRNGGASVSVRYNGKTVPVTDKLDGQYAAAVVVTAAGAFALEVRVGTSFVSGSPTTLTTLPSNTNPALATVFAPAGVFEMLAGASSSLLITSRDSFGNAQQYYATSMATDIDKYQVDIAGPTTPTSVVKFDPTRPGALVVSFVITRSGNYSIALSLFGASVSSQLLSTPIVVAAGSAAPERFVVLPVARDFDVSSPVTILVRGVDTHDNYPIVIPVALVGNLVIRAALTVGGSTSTVVGTVMISPTTPGTLEASFTTERSGVYSVTLGEQTSASSIAQFVGSPFSVNVGPGLASSRQTFAVGPRSLLGSCGSPSTFQIVTKDAFGNAATVQTIKYTTVFVLQAPRFGWVDQRGATWAQDISTSYDAGGNYNVAYRLTRAGRYLVSIQRSGTHIHGSPFSLQMFPGPISAKRSYAVGDGLSSATVGAERIFVVTARDAFNNAKTTDTDRFEVFTNSGPVQFSIRSQGFTGSYIIAYSATRAEDTLLSVRNRGDHVIGSPFPLTVKPNNVSPINTVVKGMEGTPYTADRMFDLTLGTVDAWGNAQVRGTTAGQVTLVRSGQQAEHKVKCGGVTPTTLSCKFQVTVAGTYSMRVLVSGTTALGPQTLTVLPGRAVSANTVANGPGRWTATAGLPAMMLVTAKDEFFNVANAGVAVLTSTTTRGGSLVSVVATVTTNSNGTYTATYTPTVSGAYAVYITTFGELAAGSPLTGLIVNAGAIDPTKCVVDGVATTFGGTLFAASTWTTEVFPRDAYSNPATAVSMPFTVTITATGNTFTTPVSQRTEFGQAVHFNVTGSSTANVSMAVTVTATGAAIANSPFSAGASGATQTEDPLKFGVTFGSRGELPRVQAGSALSYRLDVADSTGRAMLASALTGESFQFAAATGGGALTESPTSQGWGRIVGTVMATVAGHYSIAVAVKTTGVLLGNNVYPVYVTAGTALASATILGSSAVSFAAGSAAVVSVSPRDKYGNRVHFTGANDIALTVSPDAGVIATVRTDVGGEPTITLMATVAGTYQTSVKIGVLPIGSGIATSVVSGVLASRTSVVNWTRPVTDIAAGTTVAITVAGRDVYGNAVTHGCGAFKATATGAATVVALSSVGTSDGVHHMSFVLTSTGKYAVSVTLSATGPAQTIGTSVAVGIVAGQPTVSSCSFYQRGSPSTTMATPLHMCLRCVDLFGNVAPLVMSSSASTDSTYHNDTVTNTTAGRDATGNAFNASLFSLSQDTHTSVFSYLEGNTSMLCSSFAMPIAGETTVSVLYNENHISGSPKLVQVPTTVPLPPIITSARFSNGYARIIVAFDTATNRAGQPGWANCLTALSAATVSLLGTGPMCLWTNPKHLSIFLGSTAAIRPGMPIALNANIRDSTESSQPTSGGINVAPPVAAEAPTAALSAPSVQGSCDDLVLDATFSRGGAGHPLVFSWAVPDGIPLAQDINTILNAVSVATVTIPSRLLTTGTSISIWLRVSNVFGGTTVRTASIRIVALPVPKLLIQGPSTVQVIKSTVLTLEAQVVKSTCDPSSETIMARTDCYWQATPRGNAAAFTISPPRASGVSLEIRGESLQAGGTYTIEVMCSVAGFTTNVTDSVELSVRHQGVRPSLTGPSSAGIGAESVRLDASGFTDPDNMPTEFVYRWQCRRAHDGGLCFDDIHGDLHGHGATVSVPTSYLTPGDYLFSVVGYKEPLVAQRHAADQILVTVTAGEFPVTSIECIGSCSPLSSQSLRLRVLVHPANTTVAAWMWQVNGVVQNTTSAYLVLPPQQRLPGQDIDIKASAMLGEGRAAHASTTVYTEEAPSAGTCSISPTLGEAMSTEFTVTCQNWQDDSPGNPLQYSVVSAGDAAGSTETVYGAPTANPVRTLRLPRGGADNSLAVLLCAAGTLYSRSCVPATVTVTRFAGGDPLTVALAQMSAAGSADTATQIQFMTVLVSELDANINASTMAVTAWPIDIMFQPPEDIERIANDAGLQKQLSQLLGFVSRVTANVGVVTPAFAQLALGTLASTSRAIPTRNTTILTQTLNITETVTSRLMGSISSSMLASVSSIVANTVSLVNSNTASLRAAGDLVDKVRSPSLRVTPPSAMSLIQESARILDSTALQSLQSIVPGESPIAINGAISMVALQIQVRDLPASVTMQTGAALEVPLDPTFAAMGVTHVGVLLKQHHSAINVLKEAEDAHVQGWGASNLVEATLTTTTLSALTTVWSTHLFHPAIHRVPATPAANAVRVLHHNDVQVRALPLSSPASHRVEKCMSWTGTEWSHKGCLAMASPIQLSHSCECFHLTKMRTFVLPVEVSPPVSSGDSTVVVSTLSMPHELPVMIITVALCGLYLVVWVGCLIWDEIHLRKIVATGKPPPLHKDETTLVRGFPRNKYEWENVWKRGQHCIRGVYRANLTTPVARDGWITCLALYVQGVLFFNAVLFGIAMQTGYIKTKRNRNDDFVTDGWFGMACMCSAFFAYPLPLLAYYAFGRVQRYAEVAVRQARAARAAKTKMVVPIDKMMNKLSKANLLAPDSPLVRKSNLDDVDDIMFQKDKAPLWSLDEDEEHNENTSKAPAKAVIVPRPAPAELSKSDSGGEVSMSAFLSGSVGGGGGVSPPITTESQELADEASGAGGAGVSSPVAKGSSKSADDITGIVPAATPWSKPSVGGGALKAGGLSKFKRAARTVAISTTAVRAWKRETSMDVLRQTTNMMAETQKAVQNVVPASMQEDDPLTNPDLLEPRMVAFVYTASILCGALLAFSQLVITRSFDSWMATLWGCASLVSLFLGVVLVEPLRIFVVVIGPIFHPRALFAPRKTRIAREAARRRPDSAGKERLEDLLTFLGGQDMDVTHRKGTETIMEQLIDPEPAIRWRACAVMRLIANMGRSHQMRILDLGGLPTLLRMGARDADAVVRAKALQAISAMVEDNRAVVACLMDNNGLEVCRYSIQRETNPKVLCSTLTLLSAVLMASPPSKQLSVELGILPLLVELVDHLDLELREATLRTLWSLVAGNERNCELCKEPATGLLERLDFRKKQLMEQQVSNPDTAQAAEGETFLIGDLEAELMRDPNSRLYVPSFL